MAKIKVIGYKPLCNIYILIHLCFYYDDNKRIRRGICPGIKAEAKDGRKAEEVGAYLRSGGCLAGGGGRCLNGAIKSKLSFAGVITKSI